MSPLPSSLQAFLEASRASIASELSIGCALAFYHDGCESRLHAAEIRFADQFTNSTRRQEAIAGRLAAKEALAQIGKGGAVLCDERGRPVWPNGCVGSLSHSKGVAVALASDVDSHRALGVDLEFQRPVSEATQCRISNEEERTLLAEYGDALGLVIFSLKEACFKAVDTLALEPRLLTAYTLKRDAQGLYATHRNGFSLRCKVFFSEDCVVAVAYRHA